MAGLDEYSDYRSKRMNGFRLSDKFIDVVIVCERIRFAAHRLVLCSKSPFFENLLFKDESSKEKSAVSVIDLEDVEPKVMEILLEYMYIGDSVIFPEVTNDEFKKLLTAADLLKIKGAVLYVFDKVIQKKPEESIQLIWDWAEEYENKEVENELLCYVAENIDKTSEFTHFLELDCQRIIQLLSHPKMSQRKPQDEVMEAILRWVKKDANTRNAYLTNLVSFLSIHNLTESYAKRLLRNEPLVRHIPEFRKLASDFKVCQKVHQKMLSQRNNFAQKAYQRATLCNKTDKTASCCTHPQKAISESRSNSCQCRSPVRRMMLNQRPKSVTEIRSSQSSAGINRIRYYELWKLMNAKHVRGVRAQTFTFPEALTVGKGLGILIVGHDGMNRLVVHLYSPELSMWSLSSEIPVPNVEKMAFSYYSGSLYVIGGENAFQRKQSETYVFNLVNQTMREGPPMRVCRCMASYAQDDEKVYLVGGLNRFGNYMTHVECLDMRKEVWRIVPPLKEKRKNSGVAVVGGHVYAVGGYTNKCETYIPFRESWQAIVSMPDDFRHTTVFATGHNQKVYAFRYLKPDRVCVLDPSKKEWRVIPTSGTPPDEIITMQNVNGEFWTIEKMGQLYVFDTFTNQWNLSFPGPRSLKRPMYFVFIDLNALEQNEFDFTGEEQTV